MQAFRDRHARDAQAHVEWLAKAAAEAAAWRARLQAEEAEAEAAETNRAGVKTPPLMDEACPEPSRREPGEAGRPAPGLDPGDRTEPKTTEGHLTNSVRDGPYPAPPSEESGDDA
jgi:hypothetical protein